MIPSIYETTANETEHLASCRLCDASRSRLCALGRLLHDAALAAIEIMFTHGALARIP